MDDVMTKVFAEDISVFRTHAQLTDDDKRSLLALHKAINNRGEDFVYLEIGSNLGGSLQTFLADARCLKVYSVDKRPLVTPDERGVYDYQGNTTQDMLHELARWHAPHLGKLECFDGDAREVAPEKIVPAPALCFIDGEHTDAAAFSDFLFCLRVARRPGVIFFHDAHIVFRGIERCLRHLEAEGIPYYAYNLPTYLGVVEVGRLGLFRDEAILERLAMSQLAIIAHLSEMAGYRDFVARLNRNPAYVFLRKSRNFLRRITGGVPAANPHAGPPPPRPIDAVRRR